MLGVLPGALEDGNGPFGYGLDTSELRVAFHQRQSSSVTRLPLLEPLVLEINALSTPEIPLMIILTTIPGILPRNCKN